MKTLAPVDFKAVAATGCFVYCYLRRSNRQPYYIGVASNHKRPTCRTHSCSVPADRGLIRVLRAGLGWAEACEWEKRYIAWYGRIDNGTGILRNRTDGGEGFQGIVYTEEWREKIKQSRQRIVHLPEYRAKQRQSHLGKPIGQAQRAKISEALKGRAHSAEHVKRRAATRLAAEAAKRASLGITEEMRQERKRRNAREWYRRQVMASGKAVKADNAERIKQAALRLGVNEDIWGRLTSAEKQLVRQRYRRGWRG